MFACSGGMREAHPEGYQARAGRWQPLAICPRPAASLLWRQGAGTRAAAERQAASSPAAAAASHSRQHARADGPQWQSSQISMIEMMSGFLGAQANRSQHRPQPWQLLALVMKIVFTCSVALMYLVGLLELFCVMQKMKCICKEPGAYLCGGMGWPWSCPITGVAGSLCCEPWQQGWAGSWLSCPIACHSHGASAFQVAVKIC